MRRLEPHAVVEEHSAQRLAVHASQARGPRGRVKVRPALGDTWVFESCAVVMGAVSMFRGLLKMVVSSKPAVRRSVS
jgi:hypothetical protein